MILSETNDQSGQVIHKLIDARLIVTSGGSGQSETIEIATKRLLIVGVGFGLGLMMTGNSYYGVKDLEKAC